MKGPDMNKLMITSAAAIFALALNADVTSANVVGYTGKEYATAAYKDVVNMFVNVDGTPAKLSQFTFTSLSSTKLNPNNFQIILTGADGNPMKVKDNAWIAENQPGAVEDYGDKEVIFVYLPATKTASAKWLLSADKGSTLRKYDMSDYPFAKGEGFTVNVTSALKSGVSTQFSGQVVDEDYPFEVPTDTYMNSGNIAPKAFTLGDFIASSLSSTKINPNNFQIILTGTDGNPMKVKNCAWIAENQPGAVEDYGEKEVIFVYLPATKTASAKWLLSADKGSTLRKYDMSGFVFEAGDGFCISVGSGLKSGATFTLPNALN